MPKKANLFISESGHAKQPDFLVPVADARHHDAAAKHFAEAARHQRQAAKVLQSGHPEKACDHVQLAHVQRLLASIMARKPARIT